MKVSIVGAGVVGQATGIGLHQHGHEIQFYDVDASKLEPLAARGYETSSDITCIQGCDIHMICVPTFTDYLYKVDLTPLETAISQVGSALREQDGYQVISIRSTLLPHTVQNRVVPLLEKHCSLRLGEHFGVCHNPEFLREVCAFDDFLNPFIIVIGETDQRTGDIMEKLYEPFNVRQIRTSPHNAEAIKLFSNAYNSMKVSFFNQMYIVADKCGLDHEVISEGLPFSSLGMRLPEWYTKGGYPFGGKCLPKDLAAIIHYMEGNAIDPSLFKVVGQINQMIAEYRDPEPSCINDPEIAPISSRGGAES